jgi:hypothetical protein
MTEPAGFTKDDPELAAGARSYERDLGYLHGLTVLCMRRKRKRNLMKIPDQNGL